MPLSPRKAGVFAGAQAAVVSAAIAVRVLGGQAEEWVASWIERHL